MISIRSLNSFQLLHTEGLLVFLSDNINYLNNFHVLIIEGTLVLLDSELIAFTVFIYSLLNSKLLNLTVLFLNIVPDNIASSLLEPSVAPLLVISFNL